MSFPCNGLVQGTTEMRPLSLTMTSTETVKVEVIIMAEIHKVNSSFTKSLADFTTMYSFMQSATYLQAALSLCPPGCPLHAGTICKQQITGLGLRSFTVQYYRDSSFFNARQQTDARYWYSNSVRLSVRPSVRYVPVSYENGLTYCDNFFTIWYPNQSNFMSIKHLLEIPTGSPPAGALNTGSIKYKDFAIFDQHVTYLANDTA